MERHFIFRSLSMVKKVCRMYFLHTMNSSIGTIGIIEEKNRIVSLLMDEQELTDFLASSKVVEHKTDLLEEAAKQLKEYFQRKRKIFSLPIFPKGTSFQQKVWKELMNIPYGEARSYQYVADGIGNPKAVRAVGQANKANPIPIIIPCHRVIGKNGALVGYAGNQTDKKAFLLQLEQCKNWAS